MARKTIGPFERHLREAIILNRERAPRYAALSGGSSWPVSRRLIAAEVLLLPVARWFDWRAGRYYRAGVPLLESLFESMAQAPAFGSLTSVGDLTMLAVRLRPASMRRRVWQAYRSGGFPFAATALERELASLDANTMRNCLVRHLLESSHRLATLAPERLELASERGLPSPAPLLARLLRLHLWGLGPAAALDWRAIPLQAQGIAILAQDLPPMGITPTRPERR